MMPHAVLVPLVDRSRLTIGRAADNHVIIDASHVSSHHARVVMHEGRHVIEDAGSRNGTWLGGAASNGTHSCLAMWSKWDQPP